MPKAVWQSFQALGRTWILPIDFDEDRLIFGAKSPVDVMRPKSVWRRCSTNEETPMRHIYDLRQEVGGTWTVFDATARLTAYSQGTMRDRLSAAGAKSLVNRLNRMDGRQLCRGAVS